VKIYRINNNEKQIAFDHPVFGLFRKPNARQTRYVYIKMIIEDILLHGNSYSFIKRDERGSPISLIHIPPQYVIPYYNPIEYEKPPLYQIAGSGKLIEHTDILHFINRTNDGILGLSTLRYAADTLGLARSANEHAANFFHQG
jgi:HK97 family phage portal protein